MRASGILMPVFSLPSRYGIGCFSKEAFEFIDFLANAGQHFWQVLPLGPTGFGNSPYQSFSTFAGNPYFIDLEALIEEGLLTREECDSADLGRDMLKVDYGAMYLARPALLLKAAERFFAKEKDEDYLKFLEEESYWLDDYALFTAIKDEGNGASWDVWEKPLRSRDKKALSEARKRLSSGIDTVCFIQYVFMKQWKKLRAYAAEKNVKIIGDIPIYVAFDSADVWASPELFALDRELRPTEIAGCPPDGFSPTGQLWGNPLYRWDRMKKDGYSWWLRRLGHCFKWYDVVRIDHFRGFDEYWAVPYGDETAEKGVWRKGPGKALFDAIKNEYPDAAIIAEDLGTITPSVRKLLSDCGFPGMKVLQFAFDDSWSSCYLPYFYERDSVVYTGTHDNMTTRGWAEETPENEISFARQYIKSVHSDAGQFTWDMIREAMASVADTCVIPIQDYLVMGNESRINMPGSGSGNWEFRLPPNHLSAELERAIKHLTATYGRLVPEPVKKEEERAEAGAPGSCVNGRNEKE